MTRRDWLLLLIQGELDPIRIQKGMFLFSMESPAPDEQKYKFQPYNWGPFSQPIYGDLEALQLKGLIERTQVPGAGYYRYRRTAEGDAVASELSERAPRPLVEALDAARSAVTGVGFEGLLRRVYEKYPDYAAKSLFKR
jgi:DNA-binding PadR family transcriptional regulator